MHLPIDPSEDVGKHHRVGRVCLVRTSELVTVSAPGTLFLSNGSLIAPALKVNSRETVSGTLLADSAD